MPAEHIGPDGEILKDDNFFGWVDGIGNYGG